MSVSQEFTNSKSNTFISIKYFGWKWTMNELCCDYVMSPLTLKEIIFLYVFNTLLHLLPAKYTKQIWFVRLTVHLPSHSPQNPSHDWFSISLFKIAANPLSVQHTSPLGSVGNFSAWLLYSLQISPSIASHPSCIRREILSTSDNQTGNQPLNQICNLRLSTTHHWIPFSFDLFRSGLESNIIHIQISLALCSSGSVSSVTQAVCLASGELVCSQSSDGNHTKLDQYWIQEGELCLITSQYWKVRLLITCNRITVMHREKEEAGLLAIYFYLNC